MSKIRLDTKDHPYIAWFKKRRWWMLNIDPPGPSFVRITEDALIRITEDGRIRVTQGTA